MSIPKKPWSNQRKILIGIAVVFLLIMVPLFTDLFLEMRDAKKVYNSFNEDWVARDYTKALALITPGLDPGIAHKSFLDFFKTLDVRVGGLRSFKNGGVETKEDSLGSRTTIHAHLIFERGELDFVYTLKKTQGRWYVDKIDQE
jgi:hypothetical protein